jgi:hypothetical protein
MKYHYYRPHPHYQYYHHPHHHPHYQYHQQNHHDMKREIDIVKPQITPLVEESVEQPVESQVTPIQHEEYQNTIRFLQAKNAELSRAIITKPEKPPTKVVSQGLTQSFKIMADHHPMMDASHNVLSEPTDASNNPVKSRYFNPGFGYGYPGYRYGYPGYLDEYGYGYPGYLGGYGYGHHYF